MLSALQVNIMKKTFLFYALLVVAVCSSFQSAEKNSTKKRKPNILFLFADDQRSDALGCSGNPYISTPNIDGLAQTGVRFTNTYVMGGHHGAICAPSRAMLMSGKSLFHVYDNLNGVYTMPMHFAKSGYQTFGTGKWHNGAETFEASFQKGDNVFVGGMGDHYQTPVRTLGANRKLSEPIKKGFSTDLFADAAINFLSNYASEKTDDPFFCYVAFTAPHDPRSPREDKIGMYQSGTIPLPGNFMPFHPFKFDDMNVRDETLTAWPRTPELIQESLSDYYALMTHLDSRIGDIINTLKAKGLFDNTIIVYAADNGLAIGSHGLLGKQNLYEHSTKVPFIISGPGLPQNETRDALIYLYDIFPTLADLSGLPAPKNIDGLDLSNIVYGEQSKVRESLYTVYRNTVRAVRTEEWKLIRYPQINYTQLFNLKKDPLEINNLAVAPAHKNKVTEMMALLNDWYKLSGDTATLKPDHYQSREYDYRNLKQRLDAHQPSYILKKYFKGVDTTKRATIAH